MYGNNISNRILFNAAPVMRSTEVAPASSRAHAVTRRREAQKPYSAHRIARNAFIGDIRASTRLPVKSFLNSESWRADVQKIQNHLYITAVEEMYVN